MNPELGEEQLIILISWSHLNNMVIGGEFEGFLHGVKQEDNASY
ncbi:hypothetical protein DKAM_0193 [Desulfurococcus amylolyticus 1221n]|uniref:Uncharacterized protein n=1 Tax=Desulfurococcus amylolyticus (strain DSM 18924 / JCM 16383 / VKM B-2413 / 1221n) TaxID=490899 RepID=B8D2X4_DESA1|nr:hypothetical protein DKAM_0193 [Desulfurococcus amylolyticus 1221n]